jgi:hypothetical protein
VRKDDDNRADLDAIVVVDQVLVSGSPLDANGNADREEIFFHRKQTVGRQFAQSSFIEQKTHPIRCWPILRQGRSSRAHFVKKSGPR